MTAEWSAREELPEVQRLAYSGFDFDCSVHLVLRIVDAAKARAFLAWLVGKTDLMTFGDRGRGTHRCAVSVGFTYRGLEALGVAARYMAELCDKAPAFSEGAPARAARRLGDAGESAVEDWEPIFRPDRAHMWLSIHAETESEIEGMVKDLISRPEAVISFEDWKSGLRAKHLTRDKQDRRVHFGFRDNIAIPAICENGFESKQLRHHAGELLLGYSNDKNFNYWGNDRVVPQVANFFRNGSFAILRKIAQHEDRFNAFLNDWAGRLHDDLAHVNEEYLKAKLCGRWSNGALVKPGEISAPSTATAADLSGKIDFRDDPKGYGCPFGSHIRRTNPRGDPIAPSRLRPLFRRGMPYTGANERGLVGLFFCASIEDQFETVMSEWVEKKPMGPRNPGNAKDPLVGNHDEPSVIHIPQKEGAEDLKLTLREPFITTRGTLYAFFPSRSALLEIARGGSDAAWVAG
jgi:deferrochelatase/peroxidase EfeB